MAVLGQEELADTELLAVSRHLVERMDEFIAKCDERMFPEYWISPLAYPTGGNDIEIPKYARAILVFNPGGNTVTLNLPERQLAAAFPTLSVGALPTLRCTRLTTTGLGGFIVLSSDTNDAGALKLFTNF